MLYLNFTTVKERLTSKFPKLSKSTIRNYCSQLNKIKKINENNASKLFNLYNVDKVDEFLAENYKLTTSKQFVMALIKYLQLDPVKNENIIIKYQNLFIEIVDELENNKKDINEKSEKEKKKWATKAELLKVLDNLKLKVMKYNLFDAKINELNKSERVMLTDYVVLSLFLLQPPRRPRDFAEMVIQSERRYSGNDKKVNYLIIKNGVPSYFIYNVYKTGKRYGQQIIQVKNNELKYILKKYIKVIGFNEYETMDLFRTYENKKMESNAITHKIITIFKSSFLKRNTSASTIRQIIISETVGIDEIDKMKKREKLAHDMAHSTDTQLTYIKY
jgi:hypothetical protein